MTWRRSGEKNNNGKQKQAVWIWTVRGGTANLAAETTPKVDRRDRGRTLTNFT